MSAYSGEAARKEAAATAEVAAQQEAVMAAVEAEAKQEVSSKSAFAQVTNCRKHSRAFKLTATNYSDSGVSDGFPNIWQRGCEFSSQEFL